MRALIAILCFSFLFALFGCSNKAPKGQGGLAEHNYSAMPDHPIGLENALYFEQQLSQRHLDALIMSGANICFPASVHTAKMRQIRIARELQGGLKGDAANDLIIQRDQLTRLQRRLNYVQMQDTCLAPKNLSANDVADDNKKTLSPQQLEQVTLLLNNNNQFVFNSAQLNPRYVGQLSEVTQILRGYSQYHLKLTGHSDSKGTAAANLKLSLERAAQVERYLQIFGFNPNHIQVNGSGATQPLFSDDEPQVRLVNRRVSIELIDINHSSEVTQP